MELREQIHSGSQILSICNYKYWEVYSGYYIFVKKQCTSKYFNLVYAEPLSNTFVSMRAAVMYGSPRITGLEDFSCTKKCCSTSTSPILTRTFGHALCKFSVARVATHIFHPCLVSLQTSLVSGNRRMTSPETPYPKESLYSLSEKGTCISQKDNTEGMH